MLPALGVLLRPRWLSLARSLLAREVPPHPHLYNIYDTGHGTTPSLRRSHSMVFDQQLAESTTKNPDGGSSNNQSTLRDISDGSLSTKISILVEEKLPELLPQHSPDDAIFEVEGQEYSTVASTLSPLRSPNSSADALTQLIKLRDYDRAYSLLKEIQDLNIPIPPSFAYEFPAQAALKDGDTHSAIVERFTAWISLIPPATDNVSRTFDETCHLIFQAKVTNLALVFAFTKIMASKGYGQIIYNRAVRVIMRYSSFEVGQNFLDEFNEADAQYWNAYNPKIAKKKNEMLANLVRGLALRILVRSDRVDDALSLLPGPEDTHIKLSSQTYHVLLCRLGLSKNVVHRQQIPIVEKLRSQESTTIIENDSVAPLTILYDEAVMASRLKSAVPVKLTENLVDDLRYMKLAFLLSVPHPFTIVNFMNEYLSTGRTRALELLYRRAARTSLRVLYTFIFAEMLFYHRLRQYELVIETFVDHFYLTGVPREQVLNIYNRLSARRQAYVPNAGGQPPPERCYKFDSHQKSRGKLWPSSSHCNIIYHALVALTQHRPALEALYQELLLIVEYGKDTPTTPAIASVEPLIANPRGRPSSGAFTPFFRHLMRSYGGAHGVKILNDMMKCGIKPTTHHYTELAGFYASHGEPQKAFLILNNLEKRSESSTKGRIDQGDMEELEVPKSSELPAPDLVLYITLMRGFVISRNLLAATKVADRLNQRHKYIKGRDIYLDEVLADIERMKEEHGQQVQFFFKIVSPLL
jgi:hypothetical protein